MAGSGRVGVGQPDAKRETTGLGAEADKGRNEYQYFGRFGQCGRLRETKAAGVCIHDSEGRENEHGAHLGINQIEIARFAVLLRLVVEDDQKKG